MRYSARATLSTRSRWTLAAALLLLSGLVGSAGGAELAASQRAKIAARSFSAQSAEVAGRLELTLEREHDLVVNARAQVSNGPNAMRASFGRWAKSVDALPRYPEVGVLGVLEFVTKAALPKYAATQAPGFAVTPPGPRTFYCLGANSVVRDHAPSVPAGVDYCSTDLRGRLLLARDSGQGSYVPVVLAGRTWLGVQVPLYRGGATPLRLGERRAAFVGWLGMSVDPQVVLGKARAGHETVAATLRYEGGASQVAFTSGKAPTHGQIRTIDLGRGWTVDTAGVRLPGGILSGGGPTAILLAGSAFSTLLSALVLLLATGRARALRLVALKSKQLQHQALHDSLTGLPNRALILDRVDLALAQSKRYGTPLAAMFLDLDGFKSINDTHGHAVGDELLRQVGTRLTEATRDADTVGRLGGDEFVVLVQDASLSMGPEAIAERIRASVAEPFVIESEGRLTLQVHASIGIASGFRPSGGELLRDADIALYEAKASGKNRYVLFAPQMRLAAAQASRGDISVPQQGRVERRTTV